MTDPRMTTTDAPVTVEQCDREAAADWMQSAAPTWDSAAVRSGLADNFLLVQALARHRLAALASAPAGDGVEKGTGWVFWNPDSGEEYAPHHPIESGECVDAERVRPSTPQEDTLWAAMQDQFQRAERLAAMAGEDRVEAWYPIDTLTDKRRYGGPLNLYDPAYDKSADNFGASWDGYWNDGDGSDDPDTGGRWVAAVWCNDHDEWHPTRIHPTHYREPPLPPVATALARPRAAVGEREAIAAIINPEAFKTVDAVTAEWNAWADHEHPSNPKVREGIPALVQEEYDKSEVARLRALAVADRILALQSPPAKVE